MNDFADIQRLLIIKHGAFGDVIQSFGAIEDIRKNFINAQITVLTEPGFKKIFERCSFVDQVMVDARFPRWRMDKLFALRQGFVEIDPEFIVDLQNSSRTAFYRKYLLAKPKWSFIANASNPRAKYPKSLPSLERLAGQLGDLGLRLSKTKAPDISWLANDVSGILQAENVKAPFVTLIPGCSAKHPKKRWPYYAQLAEKLLEAGYDVVTVPGPDEIELCKALPGKALTGTSFLNWFDLAGILQKSAFVVGNDTGPTHIAVNLDVPGLALFGPHASAHSTGILGRTLEVLEVDDLTALDVDSVFAKTIALMSDHSNDV